MLSTEQINGLAWDKSPDGLLPAIVQCATSARVLMQGYVTPAALLKTVESGHVTFYSRSKQRLWTKGESSGHVLKLRDMHTDCDADSILIFAEAIGPTCHTGETSCFDHSGFKSITDLSFVAELSELIKTRQAQMPEGSYTTKLFQAGIRRIAQKVGEEGVETALAAVAQEKPDLLNEAADLLFHLLVLMRAKDIDLSELLSVLRARHK
jgi:phosphoribosyl-AMP cyclohydrolase / phosphoribosyl-ATP pyrophosphohydrolase